MGMDANQKILFVDDDPRVLQSLRQVLAKHYDAQFASSGAEALTLFRNNGPFAVVISDFAMTEMNGVQLLLKVRELDSDVVTMLFTGAATFDDVSEAVRLGHIFRLIGKPCGSNQLLKNIEDGLRQHARIHAEKAMLEETLNGTISILTTILSATGPLFFGRAQRVKKLAFKLAENLQIEDTWTVEIASTFAFLGYLKLPLSMQERVYHKQIVPDRVLHLIEGFPSFTSDLLGQIPRLEKIAEIIRIIPLDYTQTWDKPPSTRRLASVIRLARDYEELTGGNHGPKAIYGILSEKKNGYLPGGLEALRELIDLNIELPPEKEIFLSQLKPGMTLSNDLRMDDDMLILAKGTEVNKIIVELLDNYRRTYTSESLPRFVRVIEDGKLNF